MKDSTSDNAGVITIPPIIFLAGLLLGFTIRYFFPIGFLPESVSVWLGVLLIVVSAPIAFFAFLAFIRAGVNLQMKLDKNGEKLRDGFS